MKIIFIVIFVGLIAYNSSAQNAKADSLLNKMSAAKIDSIRIGIMNDILYRIQDLTQQERIAYSKKILDLAQKQNDKVLQSVITAEMGYIMAINGNNVQGSELAFDALDIAQNHKNKQALGIIYQDLAMCFRDDTAKNKEFLFKALHYSEEAGDNFNLSAALGTLSKYYTTIRNKDSALYYAQRAYALGLEKNIESFLPRGITQLATIQYYLFGDKGIAYEYMRKAVNTKFGRENPDDIVFINASLARLFLNDEKPDSALYYTNKAFAYLQKARFVSSLDVYSLYKDVYSVINSDSAVKYYKLYETVKDSIAKMSDVQQQQLLSIKKEFEINKAEEERQQNIQYALIALGIIIFITLFLLLSRTVIANERLISFFAILGLLVVFEFINLLIHPWLASFTHESPVLMLLALVIIASLLIPLHHRLEHWIKEKMIKKNKAIRLAAAKKTIEKLEKKSDNI